MRIKQQLEQIGRDPDEFEFGVWAMALMHEDEAEIERATANPIVRWLAACVGRMTQSKWREEGLEPAFDDDWHFSTKLIPSKITPDEAQAIVDRVSPEMVRKAYLCGTPAEVVDQLQPFIDAGTTWVGITDYVPFALQFEQAQAAIERSIHVLRALKQRRAAVLNR